MGAYETVVIAGTALFVGYIAGLITAGGLPQLMAGPNASRRRFAWFISILYAVSIVADIFTAWNTPIFLHLLMGVPVGWIFGVENPIAQILGHRAPTSDTQSDPQSNAPGSPPPKGGTEDDDG